MKIKIKLFAILGEIIGRETTIETPKEISCADVLLHLQNKAPEVSLILRSCLVAVNGRYADQNVSVCDQDEVAILPPVSGG